jgi:drug/metabolite transporter (DMT)-like permease
MSDLKLKGHLAMAGANSMWGLMSPVAKMVMSAGVVTPMLMTNFRFLGAALLFWTLSLFFKYEHVCAKDLLRLAGAAVFGILINQGCFIFGVGFSSPGEASIITTTMPMWVMILAYLILREPITTKKVGGILLGASGALILVLNSSSASAKGAHPMLGDSLVLLAQFSYALYLTLYKNFIKKYSLVTLMKWMFLFAAIILTPFSFSTLVTLPWSEISTMQYAGIGYVVFFGTFIAYICIMIGQKNLRPTLVGMYNYLQPVVASIVGICLGLDSFTPIKILAVALIFTGVYFVAISKSRQSA